MRQFIVTGHDAPTTPDFSLDDVTNGTGRLDVLCRCVSSAFFLSHGIREDVQVHLVLGDRCTVRLRGSEPRRLDPDGHPTAALIHRALEKREEAIGHIPAESSPGVSVRRMGFETTLEETVSDAAVVELREDGNPVAQVEPPESPFFVLSGRHDFTDEEAKLLAAATDERVRLDPEILHADHSITIAHNYFDTTGYSRYWVGIDGVPRCLVVARNHSC